MKKVAIISRHAVSNYGSLYQAIALEKVIKKIGYDVCTINYINKQEKSWRLCKEDIRNSRWNRNIIFKFLFYLINIPNRYIQFYRFEKFRREELNLTREYNSDKDINLKEISADIYCTGSDQVWNETIKNELDFTYFLSFLNTNHKRISYAASFGKGNVQSNKLEDMKRYLSKYNAISVRENTGVEILKKMNLEGSQVLDPTFLLTGEEWKKISGVQRKIKQKYVLLYQIHKNQRMVKYAKEYAKSIGCKVINISISFTQKKKGINLKYLPSYKELIALFDGAYCIVTDSFHATAFSINLNKKFVTFLPEQSTSRNNSVLELFDLKSRVIIGESDFITPEKEIDYKKVNKILQEEREKSIEWLKKELNGN